MKDHIKAEITPPLLDWYRKNRRSLPFREGRTPYRIWVSEIMLQQTRIEAVIPYFHRFMALFPTVSALADADPDVLLKAWEGLGYYSRAKNLQRAAKIIKEDYGGILPSDPATLRTLPGIGEYTAGAIASIAYGKRAPAVDGNVLRVLSRLAAYRQDVLAPAAKREATALLTEIYPPEGEASAFMTEGLMELGETVCIPNGKPLCSACPLADFCLASKQNLTEEIPYRAPKKPRKPEALTVFLCRTDKGELLLSRRTSEGLLGGMWEFPTLSGHLSKEEAREALSAMGFSPKRLTPAIESRHIFTHKEWLMISYLAEGTPAEDSPFFAVTPQEIRERYALPGAYQPFLSYLEKKFL